MVKSQTKLRAWGNSIGVVIPKELLKEEGLAVNDEVEIVLRKKTNPVKEAFGMLKNIKPKIQKSTDELLKEIDDEFRSRFE